MKKRILSLVLCAAMLLSMCLFLGAGVTEDGETCKITVNYIYQSDKTPVAPTAVLEARKGETLTQGIDLPQRDSFTPQLEENYDGVSIDNVNNQLVFNEYSVTGNVTINVLYVAGQATYTVEFYFQNIDNDEYTKDEAETRTVQGDVNAYTEAVATAYPGFTAEKFEQQQITPDEKTCIKIYYTRNYYMVQFNSDGGVNGPAPVYAKYGAQLSVPAAPTKTGYRFQGWYYNGEQLVDGKTTVDGNVTYTAAWEAESENASVTVVYWGQNANDNEYSYYGAVELANQNVDRNLTWDDVKSQTAYTCGFEEHKHTSDCKLTCAHAGSHAFALSCVGLDGAASVDPNQYGDGDARTHFEDSCKKKDDCKKAKLKEHLKNGSVCQYKDGVWDGTDYYYFLYFDGAYYKISSELYNQLKSNTGAQVTHGRDTYYVYEWNGKCLHKHTDACYDCGKIEHTHSNDCKRRLDSKMDSALWKMVQSDTVKVSADGSTVMNVYYDRVKFTLKFLDAQSGEKVHSITEKWGANIGEEFSTKVSPKFQQWSLNWGEGPYTNYIGVMPSENVTYYGSKPTGGGMTEFFYYGEKLPGETKDADTDIQQNGKWYKQLFKCSFNGSGYTVTKEDFYSFEGYTFSYGYDGDGKKMEGPGKYGEMNGSKFYYSRNAYTLSFFSGDNANPIHTEKPKFEQPLNEFAAYEPEMPPQGVESDAVFAGWYLNPQCTGEQYDLSEHKMPANNIALYAKWVNCSYTVRTYTDNTCKEPCSYEGAIDMQSVLKHETAKAPADPTKSGNVFVGWFYKDESGKEQPFSFQMEITKDYNLYPKWSDKADVSYTVQYRNKATNEEIIPADTFTTRIGNQVTITAKPIDNYFPEKSSFSETIDVADKVVTVWYTSATVKSYTVRYVEIVNGQQKDLTEPVSRTTSSMRVVEQAKTIPGYTAKQFEIAHDVTAGEDNFEIVFEYVKYVTINYVPLKGGEVDPGAETLIRTTGEARGSTATPKDGYKFVGWYNNAECTDEPVSTEATFVPKKVDGVYADATYYAKFELDVFDLTIKKAAANGSEIDPNQIFVFRVVSDDNKTDMEVTVKGIGSVTIKGLPLGTTYTVTEETDWTWQYTPDKSKEVFTPSGDYSVTFTNTYSKSNWLTSFAEVINKWIDGKIDPIKVKN
ncbi:MAG: InlB B-repeat-containing protein [Oscillospiraceae bacterium]|nr:InlB B-repeat-containing protein [Oscillospiraceae bacterium]